MNTTAPPIRSRWIRVPRIIKRACIIAFVVWQLFFLACRNVADLWGDQVVEWAERKKNWEKAKPGVDDVGLFSRRYASYCGIEQGWCMFAAPLARNASFPAVRIVFADGSYELMISGNEPDPRNYRRFGGWRQRKLEDEIAKGSACDACKGEEGALWSNYALWVYRHWREAHPNDLREVDRLVLIRRTITFPEPGKPREFDEPKVDEIAVYSLDGRRMP